INSNMVDNVAAYIKNIRPGGIGGLSLEHDTGPVTANLAVGYLNDLLNASLVPMSVADCVGDSYPYMGSAVSLPSPQSSQPELVSSTTSSMSITSWTATSSLAAETTWSPVPAPVTEATAATLTPTSAPSSQSAATGHTGAVLAGILALAAAVYQDSHLIQEITFLVGELNGPQMTRNQIIQNVVLTHLEKRRKLSEFGPQVLNVVVEDKVAPTINDWFVLTTTSRIVLVAASHKVCLLLDYSPSMKATDGKILVSMGFETVCKCLEGLSRPFRITHSITGEHRDIYPQIVTSVVAVGEPNSPDKEFVRIFLHNHPVTSANVMDLAEVLYKAAIEFENTHIQIAKEWARQSSLLTPSELMHLILSQSTRQSIGLLDLGLEILNLITANAMPVLVLITDGVSLTSHCSSDDTNREISARLVNVVVIQVGSGSGYTPMTNLGYIPNNEGVRYVAERADGTFLYEDDCPYLQADEHARENDPVQPNLYHHWFAMKAIQLRASDDNDLSRVPLGSRHRPVDRVRSRFINTEMTVKHETTMEELSFPWLHNSTPPFIDEILCNYRNYKIPKVSVDLLVEMRLNEGFLLHRLRYLKSTVKKSSRIEIGFVLTLSLHVKILYSIKFSLHDSDLPLAGYVPVKGLKIDVHVLAHHAFAILFMNVHNIESSKSDSINNIVYSKLVRLHNVLKNISDADETLQILSQFNSPSAVLLSRQLSGENSYSASATEGADLPSNYWNFLNQAIIVKPWILETTKMIVLLRSTSLQTNLGVRAAKSIKPNSEPIRTRYQVATIYLSRFLAAWASFTLSKTTYFKWLHRDGIDQSPTGFCHLQILFETESLMTLTLRFFSTTAEERASVFETFQSELRGLEHVNRHGPPESVKPLCICNKAADRSLVFYTHLESLADAEDYSIDPFKPNSTPARSYLWHKTSIWFEDLASGKAVESILENSFITLYNLRVSEGYLRAAEGPGTVTFYKELPIAMPDHPSFCMIQYIILYDPLRRFLRSEIWLEPVRNRGTLKVNYVLDYCEELATEIFAHDQLLLMQHFLFELASLPAGSILLKEDLSHMEQEEFAPTVFNVGSLFLNAKVSVCCFELQRSEPEEDISLLNAVPRTLSLDITRILAAPYTPMSKLNIPLDAAPFTIPNFKKLDGALSMEEVIVKVGQSFFRLELQRVSDHFFPYSADTLGLFASLCSEAFEGAELARLQDPDFYFHKAGPDTALVIVLSNAIVHNRFSSCLLLELGRPAPDLKSNPFKAETVLALNRFSNVFQPDGTYILESLSTAVAQDDQMPEPARPLLHGSLSLENVSVASGDLETRGFLQRCFRQSLAKTMFFCLLSSSKISVFDLERCLSGLHRHESRLDLTNFAYVTSTASRNSPLSASSLSADYISIVHTSFKPLVNMLEPTQPSNLLYFCSLADSTWETVLQESQSPLFIELKCEISIAGQICILDASSGLPALKDHLPEFDNVVLPFDTDEIKVDLVFSIYSSCEDEGDLPEHQKHAFESLRREINILTDDQVLVHLLDLPISKFDDSTVEFVDSMLLERHNSKVADVLNLDEVSTHPGNSLLFRHPLVLLDVDCTGLMREDLHQFKCMDSVIQTGGDFFYSVSQSSYWLTLAFMDQTAELHLFTMQNSSTKKLILESALDSIARCATRANQRFLLKELAETHQAREGLDPSFKPCVPTRPDNILFQLACEEQFTKWFPIQWRLKPALALSSIMSSLQALSISNRRNCIVFSSDFYMLLECSSGDSDEKSSRIDLLDSLPKSESEPDSVQKRECDACITLHVHGLEPPGSDIITDFTKMIEQKIDVLVQNVLSSFISRNPTARLSKSDYAFLMPSSKPPASHSTFLLVQELENPHLYLILLRQALLLFLQPCIGSEINGVLTDFYAEMFHQRIGESPER
ncbi:KICSTOR complex protein szt2, partial [Kappamyces sp. JEL0680]